MIGAKLRALRLSRGLKSAEVAKKLGLERSGYSNYENDKADLSVPKVLILAKLYQIPAGEILGDESSTKCEEEKAALERRYYDALQQIAEMQRELSQERKRHPNPTEFSKNEP